MLMTVSNVAVRSIGISAGLAPLKIRSRVPRKPIR
jgi:hypothetical protein